MRLFVSWPQSITVEAKCLELHEFANAITARASIAPCGLFVSTGRTSIVLDVAPTGFTYVCTDCGKWNRVRSLIGDASCFDAAQLCYTYSLKFNEDGTRVTFARARGDYNAEMGTGVNGNSGERNTSELALSPASASMAEAHKASYTSD